MPASTAASATRRHEGDERSDVQRSGGEIEAEVGRDDAFGHRRVQAAQVRRILDEAAFRERAQRG
jgi:hypothetical protein